MNDSYPHVYLTPALDAIAHWILIDMLSAQEAADTHYRSINTITSGMKDIRQRFRNAGYNVDNILRLRDAYFKSEGMS